ncbi:MAG TPA: Flp family type IVb pilin [Pirellulales bacterium]|jgi:pilus assembly protein Flp/PilA
MIRFVRAVRRFFRSEDGPAAVEYAVMLALVITVCISAISTIGANTKKAFNSVASSLGGS